MASLETKLRKHVPNQRKDLKEAIKHMRSGELNKAEKLLSDILDSNPDVGFAHMLLGNIHYKNKNYMGALEEYQQALELSPELAPVPLMMGLTYRAMEDTDSALAQFDHALQLDPSQMNVYLQIGRTQIGADHLDDARNTVEKALTVNPDSISARLMSVELLTRNNESDKAIKQLEQLANERPNLMIAHKMLGMLYAKADKTEKAKDCFETVVKLAPDQAFGHIVLGNMYFKLKDFSTAEKTYRAALSIKADLKAAQYRLADTLIALDRHPEALAILRDIIDKSPKKNAAHQRFAAIHAKQGRFDLAIKECRSALKFDDSILEDDPEIAAILDETPDDQATTAQKFLDRLEEIRRKSGKKRHMLKLRKGPKQRRAGKNLKAQV